MDKVLNHHLYEYKKGLRRLILHTISKSEISEAVERFNKYHIPYIITSAGKNNANIFFGDQTCIDVIKRINKDSLSDYTPEEDFILGTMLGYCRQQQCERYLTQKRIERRKTDYYIINTKDSKSGMSCSSEKTSSVQN